VTTVTAVASLAAMAASDIIKVTLGLKVSFNNSPAKFLQL
jgi:hypothetical protein